MTDGASRAVLAASIILGSCAPPAPAPAAKAPKAESARPVWTLQASASAGTALVYWDEHGTETLRIACRRDPGDLYVASPKLRRIDSEERLTLGAGAELATLVASPTALEGGPVEASGPSPPAFVEAFARGEPISVAYGAAQLGPLAPVREPERSTFAAACRQAIVDAARE